MYAGPARAADAPGIAFVYLGNPGDAGWTFAHDAGTKEVEAKYGSKIKITRVENVPESADSERVFRDLAAKGNKVIVGTSFGYQDFELKVARDYPDITFLTATGYKKAKNFGVYDNRMYQGAYLAGVAAGYVTKTNTLGFVASVPIPEVIRNINAYTLGARSVNPKIHTKVIWINSWFDPGKEKQAAETLIGQGADVLAAEHRFERDARDGCREEGLRIRLGFEHEEVRSERASGLGGVALGRVLQHDGPAASGRQGEDRSGLAGYAAKGGGSLRT